MAMPRVDTSNHIMEQANETEHDENEAMGYMDDEQEYTYMYGGDETVPDEIRTQTLFSHSIPSDGSCPIDYQVVTSHVQNFVENMHDCYKVHRDLIEMALQAVKWDDKNLADRMTGDRSWWEKHGLNKYNPDVIDQRLNSIKDEVCKYLNKLISEYADGSLHAGEAGNARDILFNQNFALPCDHVMSAKQYADYLQAKVAEGPSCLHATCPKCSTRIPDSVFFVLFECLSILSPKRLLSLTSRGGEHLGIADLFSKSTNELYLQYRKYITWDYVQYQKHVSICPKCKEISLIGPDCKDVSCGCGHMYCVDCFEISHQPCSCQEIAQFRSIRNRSNLFPNTDETFANAALYGRHSDHYRNYEYRISSSRQEGAMLNRAIRDLAMVPSVEIDVLQKGVDEYIAGIRYIAYATACSFFLYDVVLKWTESGRPIDGSDEEVENAIRSNTSNEFLSDGQYHDIVNYSYGNLQREKTQIESERSQRAMSYLNMITELKKSMRDLKLSLSLKSDREPLSENALLSIQTLIAINQDRRIRLTRLIETHRACHDREYRKVQSMYDVIKKIMNDRKQLRTYQYS